MIKKKLLILGVSGSIGKQTAEVVAEHPDLFEITAVSAGVNVAGLPAIIKDYQPAMICVAKYQDYQCLRSHYHNVKWFYGEDGLKEIVKQADYDLLVNALSGFVGVVPTVEAIKREKDVALANKESLVVAGNLINELKRLHKVEIRPIDSEHSALWQCLQGNELKAVKRVIITASGGSFRDYSRCELDKVTVSEALRHPNWSMGAKITIDSATMMNKCFEVVEAHHLFGFKEKQLEVILHPQSIVHSLVEYVDGALIAQLGNPDMRVPIQYALTWPKRYPLKQDNEFELSKLEFRPLDTERFPFISLARKIIREGDSLGCVVNAADEVAVDAFLKGQISFLAIETIVFMAVEAFTGIITLSLEDLINLDTEVRNFVRKEIAEGMRKTK